MGATAWEGCDLRGNSLLQLRPALHGPTAEGWLPKALPKARASPSLEIDLGEESLSISFEFSELQFPYMYCMKTERSEDYNQHSTVLRTTLPHNKHELSLLVLLTGLWLRLILSKCLFIQKMSIFQMLSALQSMYF